jgi:ATP-dependent DNA helicase RecG
MDRLFNKVQFLKGVGPRRSNNLGRLGAETIFDLFWNVPRAYFNRDNCKKIAELQIGENASIRGLVKGTRLSRSRNGMHIFKVVLEDSSGIISAVWFNQPFLSGIIKTGQELFLSGRLRDSYRIAELNVSEYEIIENEDQNAEIVPVYALSEGLSQKFMRAVMLQVIQDYLPYYPEILAKNIREEYGLCDIAFAFSNIHFPEGGEAYLKARKRLALEELLLFQISLRNEEKLAGDYVIHRVKSDLLKDLQNMLPFELTDAQRRVLQEIYRDMEAPYNMNRLLQGDVGSGKTVVAAMAMARAVASGFQAGIMAPTEILAEQHYLAMQSLFSGSGVVIARLTGGTPAAERRMITQALARGEIDLIVGTHALIQDELLFKDLGLVVIDEQHRFGVKQRALLAAKGKAPDVLVMTATPIPRTLALTVYGELEISVIDELPPGRKMVKTRFTRPSAKNKLYSFMRRELEKGSQVYVVCPLVEESEKQDLQAAVSLYEELKSGIFPGFVVGLLHGRMKSKDKEILMKEFKEGRIQLLVSTTVIEVGMDVPNASVMIIEHADRFGLSQLHQLRGRVGRGTRQSYCIMVAEPKTEEALKRLKAMENSNDGFELAQMDLLIRGPGDFWGVKQHGLKELKVANLAKDQKLIELSRELAKKLNTQDMEFCELYIEKKFKKTEDIAPN